MAAPGAGSCWQDPLAVSVTMRLPLCGSRCGRALSVVFVPSRPDAPCPALRCLRAACRQLRGRLCTVPFGLLALGDTAALERFYNADVAVVELSDAVCQPSLFYHLGVRESFDMPHNVLLCPRTAMPAPRALQDDICQKNSDLCGSYTFIPYTVSAHGAVLCSEDGAEPPQPPGHTEPLTPLTTRLVRLLERVPTDSCGYFRETLRRDVRRVRELFRGEQLSRELRRIQQRLDSVELLSLDIVVTLLLSYRDAQDYDSIISLVDTLRSLPTCDVAEQPNIRFHYAFALSQRNRAGDREKALLVLLPAVQHQDTAAPDLLCLCGRIYKDMFISSGLSNTEMRDRALHWYSKAFELEPSLHAGINAAVLLVASGHRFHSSPRLQHIGVKLSCLQGRQGSPEELRHYWDVGFCLGAGILANDMGKVIQASEKLYKLNAPGWYLVSVMETFLLYKHFQDSPALPSARQDLADFWLGFLLSSCQPFVPEQHCPVLILEHGKVLQPARLEVSGAAEEPAVMLSIVCPMEEKEVASWNFPPAAIGGISICKSDERGCFLYVLRTEQDFQLYFPSQQHCQWFCERIRSFLLNPGAEEPPGSAQPVLEYSYEYNESGERVVLGRGTYGVVYAGRCLGTQVRIAIKEIPERDRRYSQPLHEELALHKRLRHRNIVRYLGSISQDGFIKIFMEEVPGGSLSSLLRSKWGPLKDNEPTIIFYTRQILDGLSYLHDNHIVHRDIKGDNVLINTYNGVLKISDFGTSKRLAGISPSADSFTGGSPRNGNPMGTDGSGGCPAMQGDGGTAGSSPRPQCHGETATGHREGQAGVVTGYGLGGHHSTMPYMPWGSPAPHCPTLPHSSPSSELPLRSSSPDGSFVQQKDMEHRTTLLGILRAEAPRITAAMQDSQSAAGARLSSEHITQLLSCLHSYIQHTQQPRLHRELLQLQRQLEKDGISAQRLQEPLLCFQDVVTQLLRHHHIRPHWVFALDAAISRAVQAALDVLLAADGTEDAADGPIERSANMGSSVLLDELRRLRAQTGRLLQQLADKEQEWQRLAQRVLCSGDNTLPHLTPLCCGADTAVGQGPSAPHPEYSPTARADPLLVEWLQQHGTDPSTTATLLTHGFTLWDLLGSATRDDLLYTGMRRGSAYRLWAAIVQHRRDHGADGTTRPSEQ
ncbi:mitogen-activated protein kinase kinase kinase 6 isoform X3 [Coturnix japonica]|uniref:mitogen-activated protein kinase kinase kinase 6 isoform X3 n=1 Tax=Coturnix japonica TaxID=93934 RepID=UPI0013A5E68E|nr:mitogen-activated protein kinase kinase kinase 6 isoform X3 [Coturnix japonica]